MQNNDQKFNDELEELMRTQMYNRTTFKISNATIVWKLESLCVHLIDSTLKSKEIYLQSTDEHNRNIGTYVYLELKRKYMTSESSYYISFCINNELCTHMFNITYSFFDSKYKLITRINKQFYSKGNETVELACQNVTTKITNFTILCKISYGLNITSYICSSFFANENRNYECEKLFQSLSNTIELLINDNGLKSPDLVIFSKDNDTIKVHSSVFNAASPSSKSMIKLINNQKCLSLPNEHVAILEMIRFIYSGQIKNMKEVMMELFDLACTLELDDLKSTCKLYFYNTTSIENAVNIFILANKWSDTNLKAKMHIFIRSNFFDIVKTEQYKNLKLSVPDLENMIIS